MRRIFLLPAFLLSLWLSWGNLPNAHAEAFKNRYQIPVAAVDPGPGFQQTNQVVVYSAGAVLPPAESGTRDVLVIQGLVQPLDMPENLAALNDGNGYHIRVRGNALQWVAKFLKPGALVELEPEQRRLVVQLTPASYLYDLDQLLALAQRQVSDQTDTALYQSTLSETTRCQQQLAAYQQEALTAEIAGLAEQCLRLADRTVYHALPARPGTLHGVWLRPESVSVVQIDKALDKLQQAHVTDVFLETYFQGKTIYPSAVLREYGLAEQHPRYGGVDVLGLWIEHAHARGLKVHAWTQVFFAGNADANIEQYGPILQTYPNWRNVQMPQWNTPQPVPSNIEHGHYFLDPANPEVRVFLKKLILEIAQYPLDGLNLDYIRYPSSGRVSAPNYLTTTWGYSQTARKQFSDMIQAERANANPTEKGSAEKSSPLKISTDPKDFNLSHPLWSSWVDWRKAQVSSFVKDVSAGIHAINPNMLVSAVVFPHSDPTFAQKLQDYPRWVRDGDVQALTPIGLSDDPTEMTHQSQEFNQLTEGRIPVYLGIFGLYNRISPIDLATQIDTAFRAGNPGVVLFDGNRLNKGYQEALVEGPFRKDSE